MPGRVDWMTSMLAAALLDGADARVVGDIELAGAGIAFMEAEVSQRPHEAPGVRVTLRDGSVHLYVTVDQERAHELLNRARQLAEQH